MPKPLRHALVPLVLVAALGLSGCNSSKDTIEAKDESVGEVAKKIAESDLRPRAGRWESTMKTESLEIAGMPPEAQAAMKQAMTAARTMTTCLTPEQAAKPEADYMRGPEEGGCKYDRFTMGGGRIDSVMTCDMGEGKKRTMTMSGTYSPEQYAIRVKSEGNEVRGMPSSMEMSIQSKRVGECDGTELGAKTK